MLDVLMLKRKRPIAKGEPKSTKAHVVVVDGIDEAEYVLIRDPWLGTRYRMRRDDFLSHWITDAIFQIPR